MVKHASTHTMEAAIRDVLRKLYYDKQPYLDVEECLDGLTPLPGTVLDASHVLLHSIDGFRPVHGVEESST